jgi:cation diffusion facilitator family transporter
MTSQGGAWLSLGVALLVLALKAGAYLLSGSVALLSDAAESLVNVAAALVLMISLRIARAPPDYQHPYGHHKAEYLSSAFEGALILVAAAAIVLTAVSRLISPEPLSAPGLALGVALLATFLNGGGALWLGRLARRRRSAALAANARHLWTDVWTSVGVIAGVALVALTGTLRLDPLLALLVGLNIVREGWGVLARSFSDLLDARLPEAEEKRILEVLDAAPQVRGYHRLRSRRSGTGRFAEVDVFVDPEMSVGAAHDLVSDLERALQEALPGLVSTVHIEPFEAGVREGPRPPREEFG